MSDRDATPSIVTIRSLAVIAAALLATTMLTPAGAQERGNQPAAHQEEVRTINDMCPIGKEPIVPAAGTVQYDGHTIGLCCPSCAKEFVAWDDARKDAFVQLALAGREPGQDQHGKPASATQPDEIESDPYLLETCPVSGQKLGSMGDPVVKTFEGPVGDAREVRFCCAGCIDAFEANKEKYFAEIDEKMIEQQMPYYPLDTCIVMEEDKLGEMGEPMDLIYANRLVRFCCRMCTKDFYADPRAYLQKLDQAVIDQQSPHYPLKTCAVEAESQLGSRGDPVRIVVANRLVQFCCAYCQPSFEKDPAKYIQRLDEAWKKQGHLPGAAGDHEHDGDAHGGHDDHDHGGHDDAHDAGHADDGG